MTTVRNFDRFVLRPLHLIFIAAAIALLIGRFWLLLAGAVFGIFHMGTIGAKLHPHQSFSDLASGPTTSSAAAKEEASLTPVEQRLLIDSTTLPIGKQISLPGHFRRSDYARRGAAPSPARD